TLLFTPTSVFIAHPYEYAKIPYDPHALAPIARVSSTISAFSVPATLGTATIGEFTKRVIAEPGQLNWVSTTGLNDLVFKSYLTTGGLRLGGVPYGDLVQSMSDLAEGRVHVYFGAYAVSRPYVEAKKIKLLAVSNRSRPVILNDVPTAREAGHPELELD